MTGLQELSERLDGMILFMKMPPKGFNIPAKANSPTTHGLQGSYIPPQTFKQNRELVTKALPKYYGITDPNRTAQILKRSESGGLIASNRLRHPYNRIVGNQEIIHAAQWQKKGPPRSVAKLFQDELASYGGALFGKYGKAYNPSISQRIKETISGAIHSTKHGIKAFKIRRPI